MKKIIAALIASAGVTAADAAVLMYMDNVSGGRIQLSDVACWRAGQYFPSLKNAKGLGASLVDDKGGFVDIGCWVFDKPDVIVRWSDGDVRRYSAADMTLTEAAKKWAQKHK